MATQEVIKSTCDLCSGGCGMLIYLENSKPIRVEGDPESPISKGVLCTKGLASLDYLYHPDRLKYPLKRVGDRGGGSWQRISWNDALDLIGNELVKARENSGAESVALIHGANKGLRDSYLRRFANLFGTPNIVGAGYVCNLPRRYASEITCGFSPFPDYEYPPACIVIWAANVKTRNIWEYMQTIQAIDKGTKLVVIDPRKIELTSKADLWVQVRPGSDLALALAMINVIINESLFDEVFVSEWAVGFDELREHVQAYSPEKIEKIVWVEAKTIKEVARFYALNKPACIQLGNAIDHNVNSFQTARAISILRAITGNLGIPGGDMQWSSLPMIKRDSPELTLQDKMPVDTWNRRVGASLNLLPLYRWVLPQSVIKGILEGDPYPIHAAYIQGCNPVLSFSNAQETYKALKKLDFLAVTDLFMTPTASLADVVLPAASYLEFDSIVQPPYYPIAQVQQKVIRIGESRSDFEILNELAKRLGLAKYFWDYEEHALDAILKPTGLSFNEFRKIGVIAGAKRYRSYESNGFETPSRKIELYSSRLKDWGLDPLPIYYELPETPYSAPHLVEEYPLILTSGKLPPFRHSGGRQIATLRGSHPEPIIHIHSKTATKLGIKEGDWVYVETKRGKIKQKARLTNSINEKVVWIDYAWWFPEKGVSESYGWIDSNINVLTDNKPPFNREMGSTTFRGILCKVYKSNRGNCP